MIKRQWIYLEGETGQKGWFDTEILEWNETNKIFEGLSYAG